MPLYDLGDSDRTLEHRSPSCNNSLKQDRLEICSEIKLAPGESSMRHNSDSNNNANASNSNDAIYISQYLYEHYLILRIILWFE